MQMCPFLAQFCSSRNIQESPSSSSQPALRRQHRRSCGLLNRLVSLKAPGLDPQLPPAATPPRPPPPLSAMKPSPPTMPRSPRLYAEGTLPLRVHLARVPPPPPRCAIPWTRSHSLPPRPRRCRWPQFHCGFSRSHSSRRPASLSMALLRLS